MEFDVDAAAGLDNSLCEAWMGPGSKLQVSALERRWLQESELDSHHLSYWCNPPFSR